MNLTSFLRFRLLSVIIIFIPLFGYIIYRGYHLSFTHDESLSYTMIKGLEDWVNTANNHYLNTQLMSIMGKLFGIQEWSLRLPNILSFILFFSGIYLIIKSEKRHWLVISTLLIIVLNPFLIEYFSLARGYGLSLGFLMMSIYFLLRNGWDKASIEKTYIDFFLALLFGALAMGANLALINFYIAILILFTVKIILLRKQLNTQKRIVLIGIYVVALIPIYFAIKHLLVLKEYQQLYFGSEHISDMLKTLIELSTYYNFDTSLMVTLVLSSIILIVASSIIILLKKNNLNSTFFLYNSLLFLVFGGMFLEHILFDAKYPIERTALFLWPLIGIYLFFFIQLINPRKISSQLIVFLPVLLLLIAFATNFKEGANLTHTRQWFYDKHAKEVMQLIQRNHADNLDRIIRCNWIFKPALSYYNDLFQMKYQLINDDIEDDRYPWLYGFENSAYASNLDRFHYFEDIHCELMIDE